MKTINRYVLTELLRSFFFALIVMTGLLVLVMVVREALANGIPPILAVQLIPYILPEQFRFTMPMTLLLATTTFFARMSSSNEITALKSAGIAPWRILWPVYVVAILLSLLTVWLNDFAVTWGKAGMTRVLIAGAEEYIYDNLRRNHELSPGQSGFSIKVKGVENKKLLSPTITMQRQAAAISAQWAEINFDYANQNLTFILHDLTGEAEGNVSIVGKKHEETVSLGDIVPGSKPSGRPAEMSMQQIPGEIKKQTRQRKSLQNQMATVSAFSVSTGDFDGFSSSQWTRFAQESQYIQEALIRLNLEPPRRWSSGFSCFFFVWLGAPLAIWMRKTDIFASFFACFIPILILYYPFLMAGLEGVKSGFLRPESVWIGNFFLAVVGFWFLKKVHRY